MSPLISSASSSLGLLTTNPKIITNGLVLHLDAGQSTSYNGGTTWRDLSGRGNNFTIDASGLTYNSSGYFDMVGQGGIFRTGVITTSTTCTCVFWIKTTDTQSLFWSGSTAASPYLGAYRIDNKFYNSVVGNPTFFKNTIPMTNIYDNILDNLWCMVEFKSVNFSTWFSFNFNRYNQFFFGNGSVSHISIYNRNLTTQESLQNFQALRGRFGI